MPRRERNTESSFESRRGPSARASTREALTLGRSVLIVTIVAASAAAGCGDDDARVLDSGTVGVDGGRRDAATSGTLPTSCADLPFTYTTSLRRQDLCISDLDTCAVELADREAGGCAAKGVTWFWGASGGFVEISVTTPPDAAADGRVPWDFISTSAGRLGAAPPSTTLLGLPTPTGAGSFVVRTGAHNRYDVAYRYDGGASLTIESITPVATGADCLGAPRGITCTRNGDPLWDTADWSVFPAPSAGVATPLSVLPMHQHITNASGLDVIGPDPAQSHMPPYAGELSGGVTAAGHTSSDSFTVAQLTAPATVYFMYLVVPRDTAPPGGSTDFTAGPIWSSAWDPFLMDGELRRDGVIIDSEFDTTYPSYAMLALPGDGYSHTVVAWWDNSDYIPVAAGDHEIYFHLLDATFSGWDVTIPFTVR